MQEAALALSKNHSPSFLTIGRLELGAFLDRSEIEFLCRAIEPPKSTDPIKQNRSNPTNEKDWPDNFNFIYAKGPYSYEGEKKLFERLKIKSIVTKNSGGEMARAKLDVARDLGLPVIMINRPHISNCQTVETTDQVLNWLENL